ncbi:hypothetical protein C8R43DRAFT_1138005 [Mycena crocata]|nr:hypothetical protein C8R43DRAFT_1138005 [Mycena crocata]
MPDYEIYRSKAQWANVHRSRAAHARRETLSQGVNMDLANPHAPTLSDGQVAVTFIPGNPVPFTRILHPNGALIPLPPATAVTPAHPVSRHPCKKAARPAIYARPQPSHVKLAQEDAVLLARFEDAKRRADKKMQGHARKFEKTA